MNTDDQAEILANATDEELQCWVRTSTWAKEIDLCQGELDKRNEERTEATLESLEDQIERMQESINEYKKMVIEANEDRGVMMLRVQEAEAEAWNKGARFGHASLATRSFELEQFNPFRLGGS